MSDSIFKDIQEAPPDPIFGANRAFQNDPAEKKVNLTIGVYRDEKGQPHKFKCVKDAELKYNEMNVDHEYLPMAGYQKFIDLALEFAYSKNSTPLKEKRIAAIQTISGTGAIRIGMRFLSDFYTLSKEVYVPTPTWGNHLAIARGARLEIGEYRYYDPKTLGVDFEGMIQDLENLEEHSIVLFHACAHNPTGVDLSHEQWQKVLEIVKKKKILPYFDMAYQGFATGDVDEDAYAVRLFANEGLDMVLCQSFSKNLGLYGERIGCLSFLTQNEEEKNAVKTNLERIARSEYSNPPKFGAMIVNYVMGDEELKKEWSEEIHMMGNRIKKMREMLKQKLIEIGSKRNWDSITKQKGMFSYTGFTPEQVDRLKNEFHIYAIRNGRISIPGLNPGNVEYVAKAFHEITKDEK